MYLDIALQEMRCITPPAEMLCGTSSAMKKERPIRDDLESSDSPETIWQNVMVPPPSLWCGSSIATMFRDIRAAPADKRQVSAT